MKTMDSSEVLKEFQSRGFVLSNLGTGSCFDREVNDPLGGFRDKLVRFVAMEACEEERAPSDIDAPMTLSVDLIGGPTVLVLKFGTVAEFFAAFDEGGGFL